MPSIQYKGFEITPKFNINQVYTDNVFFSSDNTQDDFVVETQPSLEIRKQYRDHNASLSLKADDRRYFDLTDENSTSYEVDGKLALQATKSLKIPLRFRHLKSLVERSSPGSSSFSQKPLYSERSILQTGLDYTLNRLNLRLLGNYEKMTFDDGRTSNGQAITLSNNDRESISATLLASYNIPRVADSLPEHTLFAGLTVGKQDFDTAINADIRNNNNISLLAGIKTRYKDLIFGDIGIGYTSYDYESSLAESVDIFDIEADIDYLIAPKLTLSFNAAREVNQDSDFVQGFIKSAYELGAEYEFMHDFYGSISTGYENADFIDSAREDDTYSYEAAMRYIHNPRLESRASIAFENRDSTITDGEYDRLLFRVGIAGKL